MRLIRWLDELWLAVRSWAFTSTCWPFEPFVLYKLPFFCRYWKAFELALPALILEADCEKICWV